MKFLIPAILALAGMAGGTFIGWFTSAGAPDNSTTSAPAHADAAAADATGSAAPDHTAPEVAAAEPSAAGHGETGADTFDYVKLPQQFVVPVIHEAKVAALVVISISLEVTSGSTEAVFAREPKLRDLFLQVMFTHAHSGGFDGNFTTGQAMSDFRQSLQEAAVSELGELVHEVLVTDIVRQDS